MGQALEKDSFTDEEHKVFRSRLHEQLDALKGILKTPGFSDGPYSIGAELEMYLVDEQGLPAPKNQLLLNQLNHPQLTEELNRFNLEFNLSPVAAKGNPFLAMEDELRPMLDQLQTTARANQAQVVPIGILPTLGHEHLERSYMTDIPRYRALTNELSALKGEPFKVDIRGTDSLQTTCDEVTLEGANTSFQVHLKVPADRFAALYNAAQLITPLVLALAGNSPTFLGKRLWQETRIALFKQSIDNRLRSLTEWRQPARVSFGHGWLRDGAWESFAESVSLYPPIIPALSENEPFAELCLHHGTVWSWNRAVFEPSGDGHLRIEFRALPAGPTVVDMMANAALSIGWTIALADQMEDLLVRLPFPYAEYNFYRAAQSGLDAKVIWPQSHQHQPQERPVADVIRNLLPLAANGLEQIGVESHDRSRLLSNIEKRLDKRITGATWQLQRMAHYEQTQSSDQALNSMLREYIEHIHSNQSVADWR